MEEKRYSRFMLERIALGELSLPDELASDELAMKRIEGLRLSNEEILGRYPAAEVLRSIEGRLSGSAPAAPSPVTRRTAGFFGMGRGATFLAAAVILVLAGLIPVLLARSGGEAVGPIRIKGSADSAITIYRQAGREAEALDERSIVRENDLLQISYRSGGRSFGAILSIDGRGVVTLHFPYEAATAGALEPGGEVALDYSYRLDDAPGFERFFFLTSDEQFSISEIESAVQALARNPAGAAKASLALPRHIDHYSVVLSKERSR